MGLRINELVLARGSALADAERAIAGLLLNHFDGLERKFVRLPDGDAARGKRWKLDVLPGEPATSCGARVFEDAFLGGISRACRRKEKGGGMQPAPRKW